MADISVQRHIDGPPDKVWAIITDLDAAAEAISGITKTERLDAGTGFGIGTRWRETRKFFGKEATEEMEVSALEPQRSFTTLAGSRSVHYVSTWSVEPSGDGTALSMTLEVHPQGAFSKFSAATVGHLFKGATRKALAKDLYDIAMAVED